jgi:Ca2+-binding RTX toxin-like protein
MTVTPWSPITTIGQNFNFYGNSVQLVDGTIVVSYLAANGQITFQRYSDTGAAIGTPISTGTFATLPTGQNNPSPHVTALTDGGFAVLRQNGANVISHKYTAAGVSVGADILHSSASNVGDIAMLPNGEYVVTFGQNLQIVQQNGTPFAAVDLGSPTVDSEVAVNATRIGAIRSNSTSLGIVTTDLNGNNFQIGPGGGGGTATIGANAIATLSSGGFVGVFEWEDPLDAFGVRAIYVLTTKPDGTTLHGNKLLVNGLESVFGLDVIGLSNGGFAITYSASKSDSNNSSFSTYVRTFNADGSSTGAELVLQRSDPALGAIVPELTALSDGRVLVTWTELSNDFETTVAKMQILDPREGIFNGTANADKIYGHDGNVDFITGGGGADTIYGLRGNDTLYGDAGVDQLFGGRGDDALYGGNDADTLNGEAGDDVLFGEDGSDRMSGGAGADDLDGGAGDDGVSFRGAKASVAVNLFTGVGTVGDAAGDTYINMESFFGSEFADTVVGGVVAGGFYGFGGDDNITGTAGADRLIGGLGNDTINGLGGIDRVYYDSSLFAVQVNLAANVNTGGEAQGDILSNIEEVSGSAFGDTITGKTANERLIGNGGNDRLDGGVGSDTLVGGAGSDTFVFSLGQSGQTLTTMDIISDYAKGLVGIGDTIDFSAALTVGGSSAVATATEASINAATGVASFAAGSGTTLADALADITARMTAATTTAGEFAFFQVNNTGTEYLFISDSVAGLAAGDIVVSLAGVTAVNSIDLTGGDITILT